MKNPSQSQQVEGFPHYIPCYLYFMANEEMVTIPKAEYLQLKQQVEWLGHQLAELKRMIFGAKSERFISPDPAQGILFDLPEAIAPEKQTEEVTYTRT